MNNLNNAGAHTQISKDEYLVLQRFYMNYTSVVVSGFDGAISKTIKDMNDYFCKSPIIPKRQLLRLFLKSFEKLPYFEVADFLNILQITDKSFHEAIFKYEDLLKKNHKSDSYDFENKIIKQIHFAFKSILNKTV